MAKIEVWGKQTKLHTQLATRQARKNVHSPCAKPACVCTITARSAREHAAIARSQYAKPLQGQHAHASLAVVADVAARVPLRPDTLVRWSAG